MSRNLLIFMMVDWHLFNYSEVEMASLNHPENETNKLHY